MLTVERRPLTADERAILGEAAKPYREGCIDGCAYYFLHLVGGALLGGMLLCALPAAVNYFHQLPDAVFLTFVVCGTIAGFLLGLRLLMGDKQGQKSQRALCQQDLSEGHVDVLHCTISDVVELVGIEGDSYYFLDVGDGQVLFLHDRYGYDGDDAESDEEGTTQFPCRVFDVVQVPRSKEVLNVQCLGPVLRPSRTLDPEEDDLDGLYFPQNGELLAASLSTLVEDLRRLGSPK